jgi:hypothetical protein
MCSTIVAQSVFNWLEIVELWFVLHDHCGVGSQPALDREAPSVIIAIVRIVGFPSWSP